MQCRLLKCRPAAPKAATLTCQRPPTSVNRRAASMTEAQCQGCNLSFASGFQPRQQHKFVGLNYAGEFCMFMPTRAQQRVQQLSLAAACDKAMFTCRQLTLTLLVKLGRTPTCTSLREIKPQIRAVPTASEDSGYPMPGTLGYARNRPDRLRHRPDHSPSPNPRNLSSGLGHELEQIGYKKPLGNLGTLSAEHLGTCSDAFGAARRCFLRICSERCADRCRSCSEPLGAPPSLFDTRKLVV